MKYGKLFVLVAVLGMAVGASAQTTVHSGNIFDWVISDPICVGDGSENLVAVVLSIVNNSGDANNNPQAFDSKASSFAGIRSPGNMLHQEHSIALSDDTPDDVGNFATAIDTHFILDGVPHAFDSLTGAPEEDYLSPSLEAPLAPIPFDAFSNRSFGNSLTMTATRTGAVGNVWDLAYIVVPDGSAVFVQGQVATSAGQKDTTAEFTFNPTKEVIPTPAALPMGLMGLALIRRRRSA